MDEDWLEQVTVTTITFGLRTPRLHTKLYCHFALARLGWRLKALAKADSCNDDANVEHLLLQAYFVKQLITLRN